MMGQRYRRAGKYLFIHVPYAEELLLKKHSDSFLFREGSVAAVTRSAITEVIDTVIRFRML